MDELYQNQILKSLIIILDLLIININEIFLHFEMFVVKNFEMIGQLIIDENEFLHYLPIQKKIFGIIIEDLIKN